MNLRSSMIVASLFALAGCAQPQPQQLEFSGNTMGTTYHVKLASGPASGDTAALQQDFDDLMNEIDAQMSTYRDDSEVSRFNRAAAGEWFDVSPATAEVVAASLAVSQETEGALDVTVEPLVALWHFGPEGVSDSSSTTSFEPPDEAAVAAALEKVGYEKLEVREEQPALRKEVDGLEIDLSAVAKGYAVDRAAQLLADRGVSGFMIEIGGEVRAAGKRQDGKPWQVGIEQPSRDQRSVQTTRPLIDAAMATSGDYRNFFEHEGHTYSHIIDPRTGQPVEHGLASVSVVADDCVTADGWATALLVLGPDEGYNSAEQHGVAAMFITRDGGELSSNVTPAWLSR